MLLATRPKPKPKEDGRPSPVPNGSTLLVADADPRAHWAQFCRAWHGFTPAAAQLQLATFKRSKSKKNSSGTILAGRAASAPVTLTLGKKFLTLQQIIDKSSEFYQAAEASGGGCYLSWAPGLEGAPAKKWSRAHIDTLLGWALLLLDVDPHKELVDGEHPRVTERSREHARARCRAISEWIYERCGVWLVWMSSGQGYQAQIWIRADYEDPSAANAQRRGLLKAIDEATSAVLGPENDSELDSTHNVDRLSRAPGWVHPRSGRIASWEAGAELRAVCLDARSYGRDMRRATARARRNNASRPAAQVPAAAYSGKLQPLADVLGELTAAQRGSVGRAAARRAFAQLLLADGIAADAVQQVVSPQNAYGNLGHWSAEHPRDPDPGINRALSRWPAGRRSRWLKRHREAVRAALAGTTAATQLLRLVPSRSGADWHAVGLILSEDLDPDLVRGFLACRGCGSVQQTAFTDTGAEAYRIWLRCKGRYCFRCARYRIELQSALAAAEWAGRQLCWTTYEEPAGDSAAWIGDRSRFRRRSFKAARFSGYFRRDGKLWIRHACLTSAEVDPRAEASARFVSGAAGRRVTGEEAAILVANLLLEDSYTIAEMNLRELLAEAPRRYRRRSYSNPQGTWLRWPGWTAASAAAKERAAAEAAEDAEANGVEMGEVVGHEVSLRGRRLSISRHAPSWPAIQGLIDRLSAGDLPEPESREDYLAAWRSAGGLERRYGYG